jgi:lipopolysaccharide export LptBFGC system permease protein LptF
MKKEKVTLALIAVIAILVTAAVTFVIATTIAPLAIAKSSTVGEKRESAEPKEPATKCIESDIGHKQPCG